MVDSPGITNAYDVKPLATAFRKIAGLCDGAEQQDGVGFSKADSRFGALASLLQTQSGRQQFRT